LLRELIIKQLQTDIDNDFSLLAHLGEELPGAVRVVAEETELQDLLQYEHEETNTFEEEESTAPEDNPHKFSMTNLQLKLSAFKEGKGLTIPREGVQGDWIIKLPGQKFPRVPENEWSMMTWARESGIDVPDFLLLDLNEIKGLPEKSFFGDEQWAYAIERFDRSKNPRRIHFEDFAQILNVYPERAFKKGNYLSIGRIISSITQSEDDLEEYLRRVIFIILSGNGDAHLKNWALIYPDGYKARLSPAYDFVSTLSFFENEDLALNFDKRSKKQWEKVTSASFVRLYKKIGITKPEDEIKAFVQNTVSKMMDAWRQLEGTLRLDEEARQALKQHWKRLRLLRGE
tara:strand:- start:10511 stop:11542 length:1032 start_codon:yes stop_codon:yes gene_type:complete